MDGVQGSASKTGSPFSPATRRRTKKLANRASILLAARVEFARQGYDAATLRVIADEAGVSTGALFSSFSGKAELFSEIVTADFATRFPSLARAARRRKTASQRLSALYGKLYGYFLEKPGFLRTIMALSWTDDQAVLVVQGQVTAAIALETLDFLKEAASTGELVADAPFDLLVELISDAYLQGYRAALFSGAGVEQLAERLDAKIAVILSGFRAEP